MEVPDLDNGGSTVHVAVLIDQDALIKQSQPHMYTGPPREIKGPRAKS